MTTLFYENVTFAFSRTSNRNTSLSFFSEYKATLEVTKPSVDVVECDFTRASGAGQICQVNAKGLLAEPCTADSNYGFQEGKPCILLKLNKVII